MADRLSVDGDLVLERVCSDGPISLCGARLKGHLRCTDSAFRPSAGKAINGLGMVVNGSALFDGHFQAQREVNLASARIDGSVDMTGAFLSNKEGDALMADGIRVGAGMFLSKRSEGGFKAEGTVRLGEARISGKLKCSGGHFCASGADGKAIDADSLEADEVRLDKGFIAFGEVSLVGSTVNGRVSCEGGQFRNQDRIALNADGLESGDVRLGRGFEAFGAVRLVGAKIARELNCSNGKFCNKGGNSLEADGLTCDGKIYLDDKFEANGTVQLHNARIKTELNCTNGRFSALAAGGMTCDGNVYINRSFEATEVELMDVTVGRELNCEGGKFGKFDARRLRVIAKFEWRPRESPECVNVSFSDVGLLHDNPDSWPQGEKRPGEWRTELVGFTFRDLVEEIPESRAEKKAAEARINWLKNASYAPGAYRQLVRIYREKGWSGAARKIAIAGHRDRRKRGAMPWGAKLWSLFLDFSVGYGYRIYRTLFAVLVGCLIGWRFFTYAQTHHLMEAVGSPGVTEAANKCTTHYPCFFPPTYAVEIFVPVINLRQVSFWLPSAATFPGRLLLGWVWLAIGFGWVVTVAVAAGIGTLFSQRD